ncbi:MAG: 30S ribosomal protein S15 [Nanoarchaeota archaeon]
MTETKEPKPEWVKMKLPELEELVIKLHKEGNSPAIIGNILRDKHGVPKAKLIGKKISQILVNNKLELPSEKVEVNKKIEKLNAHITKNKHDYTAKKSLAKKQWIIRKLSIN